MPAVTTFLVKLQCVQNTVLGGVSTIKGHSACLGHIYPFWISSKRPILISGYLMFVYAANIADNENNNKEINYFTVVLLLDVVIHSTTMRLQQAAANHKTVKHYYLTNLQQSYFCMLRSGQKLSNVTPGHKLRHFQHSCYFHLLHLYMWFKKNRSCS